MAMTLITTATLTSTGIFDIGGIPQTFTDLLVLGSIRRNTTTDNAFITLNWGDETATHSGRILAGTGTGVNTSTFSAPNGFLGTIGQGSNYTASVFNNFQVYIPNYTSTTGFKTFSVDGVTENNATESYQIISAGLFQSNNPVRKIMIDSFGGTLIAGSTVSVYGILRGSGGAESSLIRYDFNSGVEGWSAANATLSASGGILTQTTTANDPHITSPSFSISGTAGRYIKVVVRPVNAGQAGGWDGSVFYSTPNHGYSESFKGVMIQPTWDGTYKTITLDMWNPHAGGSDWQNSTITSIRLDFGNLFTDGSFLIDSISISPNP